MNNNKNIEKRISSAVEKMVPEDMYERIEQGIVGNERTMKMNTNTTPKKKIKSIYTRVAGIAVAACLLVCCGVLGGNYYFKNVAVDSIVDIDVNPGIEISTNKNDVVLDVTAVNSDAEKVLDGMNLKKTELKVAVNAIIGSMVQNGYLSNNNNSILVSVQNDDTKRAAHIRNLILSDIDESLKDNNVSASVINQTVTDSESATQFAESNGISLGKATFILNLCAKDSSLDKAKIAKMSMSEIVALVQQKNIDVSDIIDYDADDSIWENIEDAIEDIDENDDDDRDVDYKSDKQSNTKKAVATENVAKTISAEKAKKIALNHAGVSASKASFVKTELDNDDGVRVYEVEFIVGNIEYDYEINAEKGNVISSSKEEDDDYVNQDSGKITTTKKANSNAAAATEKTKAPAAQTTKKASVISAGEAKKIALNHAGVSASNVSFVKAELDNDDGVQVYEIEFYVNSTEYEYEINAQTGKIIHSEFEKDDD